MAESKSKFLEWRAKSVKWFARTKCGRFSVLLLCGGIGLLLGVEIVEWGILNSLFPDSSTSNNSSVSSVGNNYDRVRNSLVGVIIGLPVFVVLWVFRTMDTREGINKTQEQINKTQEQINFGFFSDARELFLGKGTLKERTVGFIQLVQLQQQGLFVEKIKIIFKGGKLNRPENEEGAYLKGVDLRGVDLSDTGFELKGASLEGVKLEGANLEGAILGKAHLQGANLEGANLVRVNLQEAELHWVNLEGANLKSAKLQKAKLQRANLKLANLELANLEGVNLEEANLRGADLEDAYLTGAKFDNRTNLENANLMGALVSGSGRDNNALTEAGVLLTDEQWNPLRYERPQLQIKPRRKFINDNK